MFQTLLSKALEVWSPLTPSLEFSPERCKRAATLRETLIFQFACEALLARHGPPRGKPGSSCDAGCDFGAHVRTFDPPHPRGPLGAGLINARVAVDLQRLIVEHFFGIRADIYQFNLLEGLAAENAAAASPLPPAQFPPQICFDKPSSDGTLGALESSDAAAARAPSTLLRLLSSHRAVFETAPTLDRRLSWQEELAEEALVTGVVGGAWLMRTPSEALTPRSPPPPTSELITLSDGGVEEKAGLAGDAEALNDTHDEAVVQSPASVLDSSSAPTIDFSNGPGTIFENKTKVLHRKLCTEGTSGTAALVPESEAVSPRLGEVCVDSQLEEDHRSGINQSEEGAKPQSDDSREAEGRRAASGRFAETRAGGSTGDRCGCDPPARLKRLLRECAESGYEASGPHLRCDAAPAGPPLLPAGPTAAFEKCDLSPRAKRLTAGSDGRSVAHGAPAAAPAGCVAASSRPAAAAEEARGPRHLPRGLATSEGGGETGGGASAGGSAVGSGGAGVFSARQLLESQVRELGLDQRLENIMRNDDTIRANGRRKFQEAQMVVPGVWLGSFYAASNKVKLLSLGITHIVCCVALPQPPFPRDFHYMILPLEDTTEANIAAMFEPTCQYIGAALQRGGKVLVHCGAGVSRGPTICIAFLIHRLGLSADDATAVVLGARPFVAPNPGFRRQLEDFAVAARDAPPDFPLRPVSAETFSSDAERDRSTRHNSQDQDGSSPVGKHGVLKARQAPASPRAALRPAAAVRKKA